ncbi:proline/serine-rich coiled-coil protein 1 [Prinia subflava]|uniref:proline/serine-rich coiled-coil protein 1 n=1 Tax=Prinia subflava TaxID=208062 RepID=UPI002FE153EA
MPRAPSLPRHRHRHRDHDRDRLRPGTALGTAQGSRHRLPPRTEGLPQGLLRDRPPGDRDHPWHRPGLPAPAPAVHRGDCPGVFFGTTSGETETGSGPPLGSLSDLRITPRFLGSTPAPPPGLPPNTQYLPDPRDRSGSASESPPDLRDGRRIIPRAASIARLPPEAWWPRFPEVMAEDRDVRFVTEESFDFGVLSPSDSQEEEEDEDRPGEGCQHGGGNGRWSPLRGARLEEMVREATRLAAQLEGCHLPSPTSGDPPGPAATPPGTPRSPRRQTFVVKDSPVRALLPTVDSRGPAPIPHLPAKPRGPSAATSVPKAPPSRNSTAAAKGTSGGRGLPPSRVGPLRPCPPQGQGSGARGRSEPPRGGTAGQPKVRGGTVPCPPSTRQPHARTTTSPVPSGCSPVPTAFPKVSPRTPAVGGRTSTPRGAGAARAAPPTAASGCKPGPPPARLRPPRKTAVSSTPR